MIGQLRKKIGPKLPLSWKLFIRRNLLRGALSTHPAMVGLGTIQDLHFWSTESGIDTVVPLQNYFSYLYPAADTDTSGEIELYDGAGKSLGERKFGLNRLACKTFVVSSLLAEFRAIPHASWGSVRVVLRIPDGIRTMLQATTPFYFWDRFHIGYYSTTHKTVSFVHGIDRTFIYEDGVSKPTLWYSQPTFRTWAPELPLKLDEYDLSVILANRSGAPATIKLDVWAGATHLATFSQITNPMGVCRFELNRESLSGISANETLRMAIDGMPSEWGRPMVLKRFRDGAISCMHC